MTMQTIINNAIEQINQGTQWALENIKSDKMRAYKALVKERRVLRRIRDVSENNASVVLYGQSQCGKSHMASSLLSDDSSPLLVVDRMNNKKHEFLTHLNPKGNKEATGLITRFTTRHQLDITEEFPVHIKLMSIKDIVLMLCDGYYRDSRDRDPFKTEEINHELDRLREQAKAFQCQHYICEDDLGEIEEYFSNGSANISQDLYFALSSSSTDYFSELSLIIEQLDEENVIRALCMLWNNNESFNNVFRKLFHACKQLDFATDAYISFDELDNSQKTLLHVDWLNLDDTSKISQVRHKNQSGVFVSTGIEKAFLAAICAEVTLEIESPKGNSEKAGYLRTILEHIDILDFPGARSRGRGLDPVGQMGQLLRRGKVGYYFNKYSMERRISSLIFCWEPNIFEATPMDNVIRNWVDIAIGSTEEERSKNLSGLNVPPLFFVGTKYNKHLAAETDDRPGNDSGLNSRWEGWFNGILSKEIIGVPDPDKVNTNNNYKWFESWTTNNPNFDNIYLLRDFRYSKEIFDGWNEQGGVETNRRPDYEPYEGFYRKLRDSFINAPFVQQHIRDAALRWDEASEPNCDGSLTIARNLASIVANISNVAAAKNKHDVMEAIEKALEELGRHYYSDDSEAAMKQASLAVAKLQSSFDVRRKDLQHFGRLMKAFSISEDDVKKVFEKVADETHPDADIGKYVFIYMKAPDLDPSNSYEDNLKILADAYGFPTVEECERHFKDEEVDLEDLFRKSSFGLQKTSQIMVSQLKSYYFDMYLKQERKGDLVLLLGEESYNNVMVMLLVLFEKLDIDKAMEASIHHYVDAFGVDVHALTGMVADMCSEMINKFVLSAGYDYYKDQEGVVDSLKQANRQHNINLSFKFVEQKRQPMSEEHVAEALDKMGELTGNRIEQLAMNPTEEAENELAEALPFYAKGCRWRDLMKMGFVLTKDIPTYDIKANARLGEIIETINKCKHNIDELCQHQQ